MIEGTARWRWSHPRVGSVQPLMWWRCRATCWFVASAVTEWGDGGGWFVFISISVQVMGRHQLSTDGLMVASRGTNHVAIRDEFTFRRFRSGAKFSCLSPRANVRLVAGSPNPLRRLLQSTQFLISKIRRC